MSGVEWIVETPLAAPRMAIRVADIVTAGHLMSGHTRIILRDGRAFELDVEWADFCKNVLGLWDVWS